MRRSALQAVACDRNMAGLKVNAEIIPAEVPGGNQRRTGTAEGIKYQVSRSGKGGNDGFQGFKRFLGRVKTIAGVGPGQDILKTAPSRPWPSERREIA